jgi:hypothetical protein
MTAKRVGVSQVVSGNIVAQAEIAIPLTGGIETGDVVLVAPEVVGFDINAGYRGFGFSLHFGRQYEPAAVTTANASAWNRDMQNRGWYPQVTGL